MTLLCAIPIPTPSIPHLFLSMGIVDFVVGTRNQKREREQEQEQVDFVEIGRLIRREAEYITMECEIEVKIESKYGLSEPILIPKN